MRIFKILFVFSLMIWAIGCSGKKTSNIEFPEKDTMVYTAVAYSSNDIPAYNSTMIQAIKMCAGILEIDPDDATRQNVIVIDYWADYKGMTLDEKKMVKIANKELGTDNKTRSPYDYRATLQYKCQALPEKNNVKYKEQAS